MKIETKAIHAGYTPDPTTKSVAVPIYNTAAYAFDNTQHGADLFDLKVLGNIYTRIMNPTNDVLEQRIAAMEGGVAGLTVASGQAATTYAIQTLAEAGDNIVSTATLYGGTYNLLAHTLPQMGIETRFVDPDQPEQIASKIDANTKAVFCESIGNPAGNVVDIQKFADIAHAHGVPLIVDNTVATPYLCRPIEFGADIVVHSLTKYISGHGTIIGGIIVDSNNFDWAAHAERFKRFNEPDVSYHGVVYTETGLPPFILRARVVPLRNMGAALAPMTHNALLNKYMGGKGSGILSFGIKGGMEAGANFIDKLQLVTRLVNIGDAKSLACHPATTTHRQLSPEELASSGVTEDTIRLSIGIEHIDDIIADLDQALGD